jgi:hypothetical protein
MKSYFCFTSVLAAAVVKARRPKLAGSCHDRTACPAGTAPLPATTFNVARLIPSLLECKLI